MTFIFPILTFLSAFSLAAVAGWFSIAGMITIYAGDPVIAIIVGVVTECAKLVVISWLYRNWKYSGLLLKIPLIYGIGALMFITSVGVFGTLTKAHIGQGANTLDNTAKIERLDQQILREKSLITDNEKVISQLDATINSYLGKDRTDRSLAVRRSQAPQRKQLTEDIAVSQKKIDTLLEEKFTYESEIRKLELDVGPVRYFAEVIYGTEGDQRKNLESAVKLFTLIIVSVLDPLAVVLLVAANSTWVRLNEKKKITEPEMEDVPEQGRQRSAVESDVDEASHEIRMETENSVNKTKEDLQPVYQNEEQRTIQEETINTEPYKQIFEVLYPVVKNAKEEETDNNTSIETIYDSGTGIQSVEIISEGNESISIDVKEASIEKYKQPEKVQITQDLSSLNGLIKNQPHFKATKVVEEPTNIPVNEDIEQDKYPKALSWLTEFKGVRRGK